ncbi:Bacterial Pleckstrin homology domain [Phytophthora cactorum]|nr:Bacterial Pleckstrin homology domain [Phytophthora cactorum]
MLDLPSLASLLEVLAVDDSWRGVLGHDHLWKEMLNTHFGGKLPPAERFSDNEESEEEDEQEGVVEGEIQDGEDGEEDEPDLLRSWKSTWRWTMTFLFLETRYRRDPDGWGQRVDGLAFPTAAFLRNPHTGAASVIFHRAGQGLADYVPTLGIQLDVGDAIATPAFDAGVDKLIHCVGPSGFNPHCLRDLQRTYRSVLRCIQEENLNCVAMTSISTGNMGMRVDIAAWFALCAIQRYMRSTDWTATIAIVCFDAMCQAAWKSCQFRERYHHSQIVERYDYKDSAIKHVKFESAGHVDRDCEIKFHIGGKSISIDIAKGEQTSAQGIYKVLELLSRAQVANERLWEISTLGMKHASEALYLTENSGQTLHKQSDEATAWLYEAYKRTHPHCYRDVIQTAFSDLRLVDKMAQ